jgi:hypothetical protein
MAFIEGKAALDKVMRLRREAEEKREADWSGREDRPRDPGGDYGIESTNLSAAAVDFIASRVRAARG